MMIILALLALPQAAPWFEPYLPEEICGWKAVGAVRICDRSNLFDYMDGAGELYLAYDFRQIAVRDYEKPGAPHILAEVYRMTSAADAYGVYTADHSPGAVPPDAAGIGQDRDYGAGLLRFWKATTFVRVLADRETSDSRAAVLALGKLISGKIAGEGKRPGTLKSLPKDGLVADSVRFFHEASVLNYHFYLADENILLLGPKTNCVLAQYKVNSNRPRLLLISYPTPDHASRAFASFNKTYFKDKPARKTAQRIEPVENSEFTGIRLDGKLLRLVFQAHAREQAARLLSQ